MKHQLHILRLTLEAKSPISLGSGEEVKLDIPTKDGKEKKSTDVMALMRDANGLPTVPGASLQGALRRLYANEVFGCEGPDGEGKAGRISFSWGAVHGADDEAVTGLKDLRGTNVAFLKLLMKDAPLRRDHVALNARHSVDERKKFARTAVPVGTRFSFELTAWGNDDTRKTLLDAARYFRHPQFRLGGAARRGYGRIKVIRATYAAPDLNDPQALRDLRRQPLSTALNGDLLDDPDFKAPASDATRAILTLRFTNTVRVGGATPPVGTPKKDKFKTLWALREPRFNWDDDKKSGEEETRYPLPGSSFRGPLAHRMAYYANQAGSNVIGESEIKDLLDLTPKKREAKLKKMGERPELLREFLGHAKEKPGKEKPGEVDSGSVAKLTVDDTELKVSEGQSKKGNIVEHNSIDRFTGGVRDLTGVLFSEEVLSQPTTRVELTIENPKSTESTESDGVGGWDKTIADCFLKSLRDICTGRLPIGARSLGICTGSVEWHGAEEKAWKQAADAAGVPPATGEGGS